MKQLYWRIITGLNDKIRVNVLVEGDTQKRTGIYYKATGMVKTIKGIFSAKKVIEIVESPLNTKTKC